MTNNEIISILIKHNYIENKRYKGCFEKGFIRFDTSTWCENDNKLCKEYGDFLKIADTSKETILDGSSGWMGRWHTIPLGTFKKSKINKQLLKSLIAYYEESINA